MKKQESDNSSAEPIEERSEEVQDIIERMPTRWSMWVALITGVLIMAVFVLGFLIKYPDTVSGQISITTDQAPVRLVASANGRLHLLRANGEELKKGAVIGYIESGVNYADVLWLDSLLKLPVQEITDSLPELSLVLGEINSTYNAFVQARWQYQRVKNSSLYANMCRSLEEQIKTDRCVVENLEKEMGLKNAMVGNSKMLLEQDSILLKMKGISREMYQSRHDEHLSRKEAQVNLESSRLLKLSDIGRSNLEIARVRIEENENLEKAYTEYMTAFNALLNTVRIWKERYLFISPINGQLEYLGFWRENTHIQSSLELFSIIPEQSRIIGEVMLSAVGAGKVKVGQEANVKLNNFPYEEFGLLKGKVCSVSTITNKISTKDGVMESYLAIVSFPQGMRTNFGRKLALKPETKGIIEIITKPKRLIQHLFDNLKAKGEK